MRPWHLLFAPVTLLSAGCIHVPDKQMIGMSIGDGVAEKVAEDIFNAALVRCALPMMGQVRVPRLIIHYRYDGRRAYIDANDLQLVSRLRGCATPEVGPTLSFAGQVTIWRPAHED